MPLLISIINLKINFLPENALFFFFFLGGVQGGGGLLANSIPPTSSIPPNAVPAELPISNQFKIKNNDNKKVLKNAKEV